MLTRYVIANKGQWEWAGIPTIERAAGGRLWSSFFSGGPQEPDPANLILLTASADDGVSWSDPAVVVDVPGATRAYDPCLWHDPSGRLWLFYNLADLETGEFGVWAMTTTESDQPNPVWSEPRKLEFGVPFSFRLNKPTVLRSGAWLLPVTWAREAPTGWFPGKAQLQGVAISTDRGANWSLHGAVDAPPWALENMLVELPDDRVWMLIRTSAGVVYESFSTDGGVTWSDAGATEIVNPGVRFYVRWLASGSLLWVNTPLPKERRTLYAYRSRPDEPTRLSSGLLLDDRPSVSYPDAVQAPDGRIFAVNDYDRQGHGEIVLSVFTEDDLPEF